MDDLSGNTFNVKGWDGNIAVQGSDKDLHVRFEAGVVPNEFKSRSSGVPVYDPVDFITVFHPGEPLNVPKRPVNENDKHRFRAQWEAFKKGASQAAEGTPLSVLFPHDLNIVKTLEAANITTVQQLSNISDTATQNVMFGFNLREKAKKYMEIAEKGVAFHEFERERDLMRQQIKELNEQVAAFKAEVERKSAAPAPVAQGPDPAIAALTQLVANMQAQMAEKPKRQGWPKGKKRKLTPPDTPEADISALGE